MQYSFGELNNNNQSLFPILGAEGMQDYRFKIEMPKREILHIINELMTYFNELIWLSQEVDNAFYR